MSRPPEWFADAVASGDADSVNDAIDRVEAAEATGLMAVYPDLFDACRPVYESDDGYVRQSVVRFLRDAYPCLESRIARDTTDSVDGYTLDDTADQRTRLVEFLLLALQDDDGRVRRAAIDGVERAWIVMATAGLDTERQTLSDDLAELRAELPEPKRTHVEEARRLVDERPALFELLSGFEHHGYAEESDGQG